MARSFLNLRNLWKESLDELCANGLSLFMENPTEKSYGAWIEADGYDEIGGYIDIFAGATKLVILDTRLDWVLKIPFRDKKMDYCAREVEIYHKAIEAEVEECFASCHFLMDYEGVPCYIMEKVECDTDAVESDFVTRSSENGCIDMDEDEFFEYVGSLDGSEMVDELFGFYYDAETLEKVSTFIQDNNINDVHTGNVGYRGDQLVMVDYSGYFH